jgi:hypothetical protein
VKGRSVARQRRARPRMAAKVKRILVALGLVLILEAVSTIRTFVLLLLLVRTKYKIRIYTSFPGGGNYVSSSWVSNFLGFLGQHSQMKPPCILGPPPCVGFDALSGSLRELIRCLVSDTALP